MKFNKSLFLVLCLGFLLINVSKIEGKSPSVFSETTNKYTKAFQKAERFVNEIERWLGVPYSLGTASKRKGIDCSLYSEVLYKAIGKNLGSPSGEQMRRLKNWGRLMPIHSIKDLEFGDIIFQEYAPFKTGSIAQFSLSRHVMIYLWDGYITHTDELNGVTLERYSEDWFKQKNLYRGRVIDDFQYLDKKEKEMLLQDLLQYMQNIIQPRIEREELKERDFSSVRGNIIFKLAKASSKRRLNEEELNSLSRYELLLLRNGIFANHNRPFKTRDIRKYFLYHWNNGDVMYVPSWWLFEKYPLNDMEKENVYLIKKIEDARYYKKRDPPEHKLGQKNNHGNIYLWLSTYSSDDALINRIPPPEGYERVKIPAKSFGDWLRHLPLKKGNPPVYLFNGQKKRNQNTHFAVVNIDVGNKNLQQCADAIIRLRAEYLYSIGDFDDIHFNFTNGDNASFVKWANGYRPKVNGNRVRWEKIGRPDSSYRTFRKYLESVFTWAGTYSLSKELYPVDNISDMKIGDVFIKGGFPGHAAIVVDMAVNREMGKKVFLLAQSFMPAQDIYILKNFENPELSPWYTIDFGNKLITPEWVFKKTDLKRFK